MSLKNLVKIASNFSSEQGAYPYPFENQYDPQYDNTTLANTTAGYAAPGNRGSSYNAYKDGPSIGPRPVDTVEDTATFLSNFRDFYSKSEKALDTIRRNGPRIRSTVRAMAPAMMAAPYGKPFMDAYGRMTTGCSQLYGTLRNSNLVNNVKDMYNSLSNRATTQYNQLVNRISNSNLANQARNAYARAAANFEKFKYAPQIKSCYNTAAKGAAKGVAGITAMGKVVGHPIFGGAFLAAHNGDWNASAGDAAKYYENLMNRGSSAPMAYAKAYGYGGMRWAADAVNNSPAAIAEIANIPNYFSFGYVPKFVNSDDARLTNFSRNLYDYNKAYFDIQSSATENAVLSHNINERARKLKSNSLTPEQRQAQQQGENIEARQNDGWAKGSTTPTRTWGGAAADTSAGLINAGASAALVPDLAGRAAGRAARRTVGDIADAATSVVAAPSNLKNYVVQTQKVKDREQARQFHQLSQQQQQQQLQGDNVAQRQSAGWSRKAMPSTNSWADSLVRNFAWLNGAKYY